MKTAGVVIDAWELPIFRRHLDAADYAYTEEPGPVQGTLLLRVQYEWVANLKPVVEAANAEAARTGAPR